MLSKGENLVHIFAETFFILLVTILIQFRIMQEALDKANPFKGEMFFPVQYHNFGKAIVLYAFGYNFIVKPNFFETGETAAGWGLSREELTRIAEIEKKDRQ